MAGLSETEVHVTPSTQRWSLGLRPAEFAVALSAAIKCLSRTQFLLYGFLEKKGEEGGTQPALNVQGLRYFGSFCVFNPKATNQAVVATKTLGYSIWYCKF